MAKKKRPGAAGTASPGETTETRRKRTRLRKRRQDADKPEPGYASRGVLFTNYRDGASISEDGKPARHTVPIDSIVQVLMEPLVAGLVASAPTSSSMWAASYAG